MPDFTKVSEYAKAVVAAVGGVATAVTAAIADEAISLDEAGAIVAAVGVVLTVLGVYKTSNAPPS